MDVSGHRVGVPDSPVWGRSRRSAFQAGRSAMELTFVHQYAGDTPKRRRLAKACESCRARKASALPAKDAFTSQMAIMKARRTAVMARRPLITPSGLRPKRPIPQAVANASSVI
ncbi:hypothetical protein KC367_g199 [Hortaea werneckii]|nr:hypothetical protein KC367_g199 [Hortaea werneckii]